jgi:hypothetical protein
MAMPRAGKQTAFCPAAVQNVQAWREDGLAGLDVNFAEHAGMWSHWFLWCGLKVFQFPFPVAMG